MTPTHPPASVASFAINPEESVGQILGVAIFDLSGLPTEYYITAENDSTSWVQVAFQALGLKALLVAALKLEGLLHMAMEVNHQTVMVVRTEANYVALLFNDLLQFESVQQADDFAQWVTQFEQQILRQHERFRLV
ncbi:MAG: hypothetical protein ACFCVD_11075 [Nodosilinea sp.]